MFSANDILRTQDGDLITVISADGKLIDEYKHQTFPRFDLGKIYCLDSNGNENYYNSDKLRFSEVQEKINSLSFLIDMNKNMDLNEVNYFLEAAKNIVKEFEDTGLDSVLELKAILNQQDNAEIEEFDLKMKSNIACRELNKYFRYEYNLVKT